MERSITWPLVSIVSSLPWDYGRHGNQPLDIPGGSSFLPVFLAYGLVLLVGVSVCVSVRIKREHSSRVVVWANGLLTSHGQREPQGEGLSRPSTIDAGAEVIVTQQSGVVCRTDENVTENSKKESRMTDF